MKQDFVAFSKLYNKNQKLVCSEKGKRLELQTNQAEFYKIKIDNGVEQNIINRKCDFLILKAESENIWIYVELKGKRVKVAKEQILSTYERYKENKPKDSKYYAAIVVSKATQEIQTPKKSKTNIQNLKNELMIEGFKDVFLKEKYILLSYEENNADPIRQTN